MLDIKTVQRCAVGLATLLGCSSLSLSVMAQQAAPDAIGRVETFETSTDILQPEFMGTELQASSPGPAEAAEADRLYQSLLELREEVASKAAVDFTVPPGPRTDPPGWKGAEVEETAETEDFLILEGDSLLEQNLDNSDGDSSLFNELLPPGNLVVAKNAINTVLPASPQFKSSLGEPAAVNEGRNVFYTGNTFASFSPNRGFAGTWFQRNFPNPPFAGAIMCCDQDVEYSEGRKRTFWSTLWLDAARTRGVVQIAVMNSPISAPSCWYNISFGTTTIPDYPHIGLSNDFLYLSTNNITTTNGTWSGSQMWRLALDQMAECQGTPVQIFTWATGSQRVFVPVEGANDIMYWGLLNNSTSFRVFSWPEASNAVTSVSRAVSTSPHNNPDCRGGIGNNDFVQRSTSWSITGFRMRGWYGQPNGGGGRDAVGWMWNVGVDAAHPQGHIHSAVFDADSRALIGQPHIWNPNFCLAYPDVAPTERGHPAVVLAYGGRAGGGGVAARNAVMLGDDLAVGGPFGPFATVAVGTHNRTDGRFGDYFTIQQHSPCDMFLSAASYVLVDGTAGANAQHHYINFGRNRDTSCFLHWDPR